MEAVQEFDRFAGKDWNTVAADLVNGKSRVFMRGTTSTHQALRTAPMELSWIRIHLANILFPGG